MLDNVRNESNFCIFTFSQKSYFSFSLKFSQTGRSRWQFQKEQITQHIGRHSGASFGVLVLAIGAIRRGVKKLTSS